MEQFDLLFSNIEHKISKNIKHRIFLRVTEHHEIKCEIFNITLVEKDVVELSFAFAEFPFSVDDYKIIETIEEACRQSGIKIIKLIDRGVVDFKDSKDKNFFVSKTLIKLLTGEKGVFQKIGYECCRDEGVTHDELNRYEENFRNINFSEILNRIYLDETDPVLEKKCKKMLNQYGADLKMDYSYTRLAIQVVISKSVEYLDFNVFTSNCNHVGEILDSTMVGAHSPEDDILYLGLIIFYLLEHVAPYSEILEKHL